MPASVVAPQGVTGGPYLRVLQCFTCRSMQQLPDFDGQPDDDVVLHLLDDSHGGHEDDPVRIHQRALHRIPETAWADVAARKQIVEQMWASTTGFAPTYYDVQNTLREDALKCYSKHLRPQVSCPDYRSRSKRLSNPAAEMRRYVGLDPKGGPRVYLCQFCPMDTVMRSAMREG